MTYRWLHVADPLPECSACEEPTRRATWERTGGLCSSCASVVEAVRRGMDR